MKKEIVVKMTFEREKDEYVLRMMIEALLRAKVDAKAECKLLEVVPDSGFGIGDLVKMYY